MDNVDGSKRNDFRDLLETQQGVQREMTQAELDEKNAEAERLSKLTEGEMAKEIDALELEAKTALEVSDYAKVGDLTARLSQIKDLLPGGETEEPIVGDEEELEVEEPAVEEPEEDLDDADEKCKKAKKESTDDDTEDDKVDEEQQPAAKSPGKSPPKSPEKDPDLKDENE